MKRILLWLPGLGLILLICWELAAYRHAELSGQSVQCPQQALAHAQSATRGFWRRPQRMQHWLALALAQRDYSVLALHGDRLGSEHPALQASISLALDSAGHARAQPLDADMVRALCADDPGHCIELRITAAQWWLQRGDQPQLAPSVLGVTVADCLRTRCVAADVRLIDAALQLSWRLRSARGEVHDWLAQPDPRLEATARTLWQARAALDRDQLDAAESALAAFNADCAGPDQQISAALLRSSLALRRERYQDAHQALSSARQQIAGSGQLRGAGQVLPHTAYLALRQGHWQRAAADYRALSASDDAWQRRDGWAGLGHTQMHLGAYAEADQSYLRALEEDLQIAAGDPRFRSRILSMRAQSALQRRKPALAEEIVAEALRFAETGDDLAGRVTGWLTVADVRHRLGQSAAALDAIDFALSLQWQTGPGDSSPFLSTQYVQAIERVHALARDAPELRARALGTLWGLLEAMRHRPLWQSPAARPSAGARMAVDPELMSRHLDSDSQVLVFGFAGEQAFVLRLDRAGLVLTDLPAARAGLEELSARWLGAMRQAQHGVSPAHLAGLSTQLHAALMQPIYEAGLRRGTRLIVLGSGALRSLPWPGLQDAVSKRFLIEDHEVLHVDTLFWSLRPALQSTQGQLVIAAAGAPPGARAEAEWLAGRLDTPLIDAAQTERDDLLGQLSGASLVHFAGHANADAGNPLNAYLQLGDPGGKSGRYTVAEILRSRVSARLIVLGACETSFTGQASDWTLPVQSDPASAFIHAGAFQVVSSILPAHDETTGALMRAFYRHLPDHDAVAALALAQRELAATQPPALWAGFRISGSFLEDAATASSIPSLESPGSGRSRHTGGPWRTVAQGMLALQSPRMERVERSWQHSAISMLTMHWKTSSAATSHSTATASGCW